MRKSQLRQHVENYCHHHHTGSYRDKKHRHFVLHKMIRDLFHIGSVPTKWHGLTCNHIQNLVSHWQKEKIKPSTIMKYMTIIRDFFQNIEHQINDIDNQSLGIINRKQLQKAVKLPNDILQKLSNPIAKILFEFQVHFGLTLSEAMRLRPAIHIQENTIWITRNIATNSQDRMIPFRNDEQIGIINTFQALCTQEQSLISTYGYHHVRYAYHNALKTIGLPALKTYRYLYARKMNEELIKTLSNYMTKQTIMREMGLQSRRTLWSYLNE